MAKIKELTKEAAAIKFVAKIAKFELGCAPSAGLMMELINEARAVLKIESDKQGRLF